MMVESKFANHPPMTYEEHKTKRVDVIDTSNVLPSSACKRAPMLKPWQHAVNLNAVYNAEGMEQLFRTVDLPSPVMKTKSRT